MVDQSLPALGLFGGTFDPIHLGHLHVALSCCNALNLSKIRLIPSAMPLLRQPPLVNPEQRLAMVKMAIEGHPQLEVDDIEIMRDGPSYAIDTVIALRKQLPDTSLCYIIGVDQFSQFDRWQRWEEFTNYVHLIVTTRSGYKMNLNKSVSEFLKQQQVTDRLAVTQKPAGGILLQFIVPLSLSATEIRQRILQGKHPEAYLPQAVAHYIQQEQLYK